MTKHNASEILGIIFPFLPRHAERLLDGGKDVFAKYLARANLAGLKVGNRILFYVSGGSRQIVGEARIGQIEFLTPDQLLEKYEDRLFITREELRQYTTKQPGRTSSKPLFVAILNSMKKYAMPVVRQMPITMAGINLTKDVYRSIIRSNALARQPIVRAGNLPNTPGEHFDNTTTKSE